MRVKKENVLKVELKGTDTDTFKSVMKKCSKLTTKIGFGTESFTEKELELIKDLNKEL